MTLLINLVLFLLSAIVLVISGSWLIKSLTKIAQFLRLSEFVVGFIIMAFATSIPELFIGITSALANNAALALGTVIGSNIADLTFVIGIVIILSKGINIENKNIKKDAMFMFFIALLPMILMFLGGGLSRDDGIILLFILFLYTYRKVRQKSRFRKELEDHIKRTEIVFMTFLFILSLALLFGSANFVVKYATLLSIDLFLPPILIGLFLIAIGTSLPELVFETRAVLTGHSELALGDLMGSVIVNSTLVLGITALIQPITASLLLFLTSAVFMMIVAFLFMTFVESGSRLYLKEGISLILLYFFFIMIEFYVKTLNG